MISINISTSVKLTDRSAVSLCMLGVSNRGTGLSGIPAVRPASSPCPRALWSVSAMSDRPRHWKQQ